MAKTGHTGKLISTLYHIAQLFLFQDHHILFYSSYTKAFVKAYHIFKIQ